MTQRKMGDMIRDRTPVTLGSGKTVRDACRLMRDRRVGAVLVTDDDDRLVGIFTGRDAVCRVLAEGRDAAATPLADVMTRNPDAILPGTTAIDALRLMQDGGYRHIPIAGDDGRVAGIVSTGDFRGLEKARLDEETDLWERI